MSKRTMSTSTIAPEPKPGDPPKTHNVTYTQSFMDIATTLMTISVFAGAISFSSLGPLPMQSPDPLYTAHLLSIAANLFTCSMFVAMGIPYILRKEPRDGWPAPRKAMICQIHVWLTIGLLMAGFVVLNIVIIEFGQLSVCIAGITLLGLIPLWFIGLKITERTGFLGKEVSPQRHLAESNPTTTYHHTEFPVHA